MGRQNRKLLENIRKYDEKEKIKQSKSQILGQKLVKGKTNMKLAVLDEINQIDRRLKKSKIRNNEEETSKLMSQRNKLREKLKTNRKLIR